MSTKTSRTDRAPLVFVPLRTDEAASLVTTGTLGGSRVGHRHHAGPV